MKTMDSSTTHSACPILRRPSRGFRRNRILGAGRGGGERIWGRQRMSPLLECSRHVRQVVFQGKERRAGDVALEVERPAVRRVAELVAAVDELVPHVPILSFAT